MTIVATFYRWWNNLASKNGKLKFNNQREAAEFIRRTHNQSSGANAPIIEMRNWYNDISQQRALLSLQAWGASSKADAKRKAAAISARNNGKK